MAAPWEKYQATKPKDETGPWSKFQKTEPPPAPDRSFEVPTPQNLAADRARPVQPSQPRGMGERAQEAAGNVFPMARSFSRRGAAEMLGPSISAVTTTGSALVGTPLGPAGVVGGAGLGYGIGEEIIRRIRGDQPTAPSQTIRDIATGATLEAGGRAVLPLVSRVARGAGKISDLFDLSRIRASRIAKKAVGPRNIEQARAALQSAAGEDITAAQALARLSQTGEQLNLPVAQALLRRAAERDPDFFTTLFSQQDMARIRSLEQLAGGTNQTAANEARKEMQKLLNERLIPTLRTEMEAANIAGRMVPKMQQQISDLEGAAAGRVEDVRRMTAAAERARGTQEFPVPGMPRVSTQITYRGDLARAADQFAEDAASGSLRLGEAARFKQAAMQSLEAHGQRPLTADSINRAIQTRLADPRLAPGNRDLQTALTRVKEDIAQWTNADGIIDAWALDTIRKNSINAYINSLPLNPKQARRLAADLTEQIRPVLIDAMETAGGTGYRQYLQDYARGMQLIGQSKLGAEAMKLYAENPAGFVKLVEGNSPEKIRKIFGPGSDSIFKELSANTQRRLGGIANELKREAAIDAQAAAGEKALVDLMRDNMKLFRLPNFLNIYATSYNNAISALETKVGAKTLQIITDAAKNAKSFDQLLSVLPTADRNVFLLALQDPSTLGALGKVVAGAERLAGGVSAGSLPFVQAYFQSNKEPNPSVLDTTRMGGITNVSPRLGAPDATR